MMGSQLYNDYKTARSTLTAPYDLYAAAVKAAKTSGAIESAKMASQGSNYLPFIPGGFPKF